MVYLNIRLMIDYINNILEIFYVFPYFYLNIKFITGS